MIFTFLLLAITSTTVAIAETPAERNVAFLKKAYENPNLFFDAIAPNSVASVSSAAQVIPLFQTFTTVTEVFAAFAQYNTTSSSLPSFTVNDDGSKVVVTYASSQTDIATSKSTVNTLEADVYTFNSKGKIADCQFIIDTAAYIDMTTFGQTPYSLMQLATSITQDVNEHDPTLYDSYFAPNCAFTVAGNSTVYDTKQAETLIQALFASFPDIHATIIKLIANDNDVVKQSVITGTFTGAPFFGYPPTGKRVTFDETLISTIANGKIVAEYSQSTLLSQVGPTTTSG
jgi:predicted ester cyclase